MDLSSLSKYYMLRPSRLKKLQIFVEIDWKWFVLTWCYCVFHMVLCDSTCTHMFCFCPLLCDWANHSLEYFIKYWVCFNVAMSFFAWSGQPWLGKLYTHFLSTLVVPSSYLITILEYRECLNDRLWNCKSYASRVLSFIWCPLNYCQKVPLCQDLGNSNFFISWRNLMYLAIKSGDIIVA